MPERERIVCGYCGGWSWDGSTCPRSVECPTCGAGPGVRCVRPSGHGASQLHAERIKLAEAGDTPVEVERDPLDVWRDTFGTGELVAEGEQSSLWLGDTDTPPEATLAEIEAQARAEADRRG